MGAAVDVDEALSRLEKIEEERAKLDDKLSALDDRQSNLDGEFDALNEERRLLVESRDKADAEFTELYAALDELAPDPSGKLSEDKPAPVIPPPPAVRASLIPKPSFGGSAIPPPPAIGAAAPLASPGVARELVQRSPAVPSPVKPEMTQRASLTDNKAFVPPIPPGSVWESGELPAVPLDVVPATPSPSPTTLPWWKQWKILAAAGVGFLVLMTVLAAAFSTDEAPDAKAANVTSSEAGADESGDSPAAAAPGDKAKARAKPKKKRNKKRARAGKKRKGKGKAKPKSKSKAAPKSKKRSKTKRKR